MSTLAQLSASDLGFAFGPRVVLEGVSLTLAPGDRIGVIGANGSGKSTLLRILAGELQADRGVVSPTPPHATVGLLHQELDDRPGDTIGGFLARRSGVAAVLAEFDAAILDVSEGRLGADERYDRALARYTAVDAAAFDERVLVALAEAGLVDVSPTRATASLSGGQRARVGLAAVTLAAFDILLLDEPTNDLDLSGLELLERLVRDAVQPMAIVSHDREFLANTATAIVEIDDHTHVATRFNGGYDAWLTERERARQRHQEAYDEYQAKRAELGNRARRERQWSARGARRARTDKSEKDRSIRAYRIETSENLAGKAKQTERALERLEREEAVEAPWKPWELQLRFGEAQRAGQEVAVLRGVVAERGDFTLGPVDVVVESGDRILVTGPNGSGKTTLLDVLLGRLEPTSGVASLGPSVRVGLLTQSRSVFADAASLARAFADAAGCDEQSARSQLAKLGLDASRLDRPVAGLSLGERTRAALGLFAARGTNLLVVDEPTNHLDLPAIEALEAALAIYPHTLLLVSHDRRLVESVTTDRRWTLEVADGASRLLEV